MRALTGPKAKDKPADPIIVHPDVRKMLLTARAYAEAGRALCDTALMLDKELSHPDADVRREAADEVALLTPSSRPSSPTTAGSPPRPACRSSAATAMSSEWGMEQYVRDARINMIYEGTNTIQSLDLLGRKVLADNGKKLKAFGRRIAEFVEDAGVREAMQEFINPLADLGDKVTKLTTELGMKAFGNADEVGAAAVDYLRGGRPSGLRLLWARMAQVALDRIRADGVRSIRSTAPSCHRALLLRQAAARDRRADPHRAFPARPR